jgi:mono/diheme cytochrome c family protein
MCTMRRSTTKRRSSLILSVILGVLAISLVACASAATPTPAASPVERGRYMVIVGGCNDCHTAGYAQQEGNAPEEQWLTGDSLGWHGPWGTTYPPNLRLYMQDLTEDEWVAKARDLQARPPMPWFNVNKMTEEDLRALYQFIRFLGPAGEPAPEFLPPDQEPPPPYIQFP